jgi:hypothetical protein
MNSVPISVQSIDFLSVLEAIWLSKMGEWSRMLLHNKNVSAPPTWFPIIFLLNWPTPHVRLFLAVSGRNQSAQSKSQKGTTLYLCNSACNNCKVRKTNWLAIWASDRSRCFAKTRLSRSQVPRSSLWGSFVLFSRLGQCRLSSLTTKLLDSRASRYNAGAILRSSHQAKFCK